MSTRAHLYVFLEKVKDKYGNTTFLCSSLYGRNVVLGANYYNGLVHKGLIAFKTKSLKSKLIEAF